MTLGQIIGWSFVRAVLMLRAVALCLQGFGLMWILR